MSDIGNKAVFAKNLSNQMNRKKIDRKKLCADLGFKYSTISEWLAGRKYPRIDKIELLARYFGILKSDLIEDKTNMARFIRDRASKLCQEKGVTLEQMESDLNIDLNVLTEFNKSELEDKIYPISEEAYQTLEKIAIYLETTMAYLQGYMDSREQSRMISGKEIWGIADPIDITPKDMRFRRIVLEIDSLPDPDRSSLLDQIENLMKFYHQTLLNRQKVENNDQEDN